MNKCLDLKWFSSLNHRYFKIGLVCPVLKLIHPFEYTTIKCLGVVSDWFSEGQPSSHIMNFFALRANKGSNIGKNFTPIWVP